MPKYAKDELVDPLILHITMSMLWDSLYRELFPNPDYGVLRDHLSAKITIKYSLLFSISLFIVCAYSIQYIINSRKLWRRMYPKSIHLSQTSFTHQSCSSEVIFVSKLLGTWCQQDVDKNCMVKCSSVRFSQVSSFNCQFKS